MLNAVKLYLKANVFMTAVGDRARRGRAGRSETAVCVPDLYAPSSHSVGIFKDVTHLGGKLSAGPRQFYLGRERQFAMSARAVLWVSDQESPHRFLADRLWERDGQHVIFMEDYDFRTGRGKIVASPLIRMERRLGLR